MRPAIEYVFKAALSRPVAELTRTELQLIATAHPKAGGAATAVRCLRPVLRWGEENGYVSAELIRIRPPAKVQRRKRVLSHDELERLITYTPPKHKAACSADAIPTLHAGASRRSGIRSLGRCRFAEVHLDNPGHEERGAA